LIWINLAPKLWLLKSRKTANFVFAFLIIFVSQNFAKQLVAFSFFNVESQQIDHLTDVPEGIEDDVEELNFAEPLLDCHLKGKLMDLFKSPLFFQVTQIQHLDYFKGRGLFRLLLPPPEGGLFS
jgi:hypothetical protein